MTDWFDVALKVWAGAGPLVGAWVAQRWLRQQAKDLALQQATLARANAEQVETRAALRERVSKQYEAVAELSAVLGRYGGKGPSDDARVAMVALTGRVSSAFAAPKFAADLYLFLGQAMTWRLADREGREPDPALGAAIGGWGAHIRAEMLRVIALTEASLGTLPTGEAVPVMPRPPKALHPMVRETREMIMEAFEKAEQLGDQE